MTSTGYGHNVNVSWLEAIYVYNEMIKQTRANIHLAVIGQGPYRLAPEASNLLMSQKN